MFWQKLCIGLAAIAVLGAFSRHDAVPSGDVVSDGSTTDSLVLDTLPLGFDEIINPICNLNADVMDYFQGNGLNIDEGANPKLYQAAFDWKGTRYKYGGTSKEGIDCSSLIKAVYYESFDEQLQGTSRSLYGQIKAVDQSELQEGDLVFFKIRGNTISHVGLYLRDGYFVHASVKRGVMINNLSESYYKKYFFEGGPIQ